MTYVATARFGRRGLMPQASAGLGYAALGAIPWQCWDAAGFKDCHAGCWEESKNQCDYNVDPDAFGSKEECIATLTDQCAVSRCVPEYCASAMPEQSPATTLPCTDYRVIRRVQSTIGAKVDGAWGPNSQKAYEAYVLATGQRYEDIVTGCTGASPATEPTIVKPPVPVTPVPVLPTPVVPIPTKKPGLTKANMIAGGIVVAVLGAGAYIYAKKKGLMG